jgi:type I restriction enzyme S subunit
MYRFRPDPTVMDPRFLELYLLSAEAQRAINAMKTGISDSGLNLTQDRFLELHVPVPNLSEQRRIVEILEDHLSRLDAAEKFLNDANQRATLLQASALTWLWDSSALFTHSWRSVSSVGRVVTGSTPGKAVASVAFGSDVPFLTPTDVPRGGEIVSSARSLSSAGAAMTRRVRPGAVAVVCIGATLGKVGWIGRDCCANQQINLVKPALDVSPAYLAALMASPPFQRAMWSAASSTTLPILNKSRFSALQLPIAPLDEQHRMLAGLTALRDGIRSATGAADMADRRSVALRRALLSAAFSGRLASRRDMADVVEEMVSV